MQECVCEDLALRRNIRNYNEDVLINDISETGVREFSAFNNIPFFHVAESSSEDTTHSVEEGILKYNVSGALKILIYEDEIFTLEQLNKRMQDFSYGEEEKSNTPKLITKKHLDESKLKMTAAETANFVHNIPFLLGDLVPEGNEAWRLKLLTVKFFDFCYLPCYGDKDLADWKQNIADMHTSYINVCETHLKLHHHISIHFPTDTLKMGPLRYLRTIRQKRCLFFTLAFVMIGYDNFQI